LAFQVQSTWLQLVCGPDLLLPVAQEALRPKRFSKALKVARLRGGRNPRFQPSPKKW
jgi:hypothetical protein